MATDNNIPKCMVLPTNISIRLTCNVQLLSMLQTTHWLKQQQQMHLLHMILTLIHRLIPSTDSELRGNVKLQRHMRLRRLYVTDHLVVVIPSNLHVLLLFAFRWSNHMEPQFCLSFCSTWLLTLQGKWLRGVLQQEPVEDIWVQDDQTGKWRKWHNERGNDLWVTG